MAKVAIHHTTSGQTLYAWFLNSTGQLWNGSSFENYATANIATYNVSMTEQGTASMLYEATVPSMAAGFYGVMAKRRVGGSVAESDPVVGSGSFGWTGTDFAALDVILADSVPADGTRPSAAQALYAIYQFLTERSVSGTTMTVAKPDGTTALMTFTLNDATSPTSITRAS